VFDVAAKVVGKTAIGEGYIGSPLQNGDFRFSVQSAGPGCCGCSGGDASNYHYTFHIELLICIIIYI
jgi:hypothetical protein